MNAEDIIDALKAASLRQGDVEVSFVGAKTEAMTTTVRVQLIVFKGGHVDTIKEQGVQAPAPLFHDAQRTKTFAAGLRLALAEALQAPTESFERAMPSELVFFEVLELKKPRTPEEFRDALLTKKRLGRFCAENNAK